MQVLVLDLGVHLDLSLYYNRVGYLFGVGHRFSRLGLHEFFPKGTDFLDFVLQFNHLLPFFLNFFPRSKFLELFGTHVLGSLLFGSVQTLQKYFLVGDESALVVYFLFILIEAITSDTLLLGLYLFGDQVVKVVAGAELE